MMEQGVLLTVEIGYQSQQRYSSGWFSRYSYRSLQGQGGKPKTGLLKLRNQEPDQSFVSCTKTIERMWQLKVDLALEVRDCEVSVSSWLGC